MSTSTQIFVFSFLILLMLFNGHIYLTNTFFGVYIIFYTIAHCDTSSDILVQFCLLEQNNKTNSLCE